MKKEIYKIDENGYLQFGQVILIEENEEMPIGYTDIPLPKDEQGSQLPFYRPKWNGTEWIEDMSQVEIDKINNQPNIPSVEERLKMAEDTILFLMDMNLMGGM